jgi:hypothetical protein
MKKARTKGDAWRETAETWLQETGEAMEKAYGEYFKKKHKYARPRLKPPERLTVQVFTNCPVIDRIADEWKLMKIWVRPKYTLEEIYHKARVRWKERWGINWQEEEMMMRSIWKKDCQRDWSEIKRWIEGTNYRLFMQMKGTGKDQREKLRRWKGWNKFFRQREWRREGCKCWLADHPEWEDTWKEPKEWLPGEKEWIEG